MDIYGLLLASLRRKKKDMNEKRDYIEETKEGMVEGKLKKNIVMHFTK